VTDASSENWTACRPGELERLAARLAFRTKLRVAALAAAVTLAVGVLVAGGWYALEILAGPPADHDVHSGCGCGSPQTDAPTAPPTGAK